MNQHMPCKGYGNNSSHAIRGSGMEPGRFGAVLGRGSARFVCHARNGSSTWEAGMAKHKDKGRFRLIRGGKIPNEYLEDGKNRFEYDPRKSNQNMEKHGIDFEEAQALWGDPRKLEMHSEYRGGVSLCSYWPSFGRTLGCNSNISGRNSENHLGKEGDEKRGCVL